MGEAEIMPRETTGDQRDPEIPLEQYLEIPVIPEDPEEIAVREEIHERIQVEIQHEDKEVEAVAEEMLEVPPEWNEVLDLMMEEKKSMSSQLWKQLPKGR